MKYLHELGLDKFKREYLLKLVYFDLSPDGNNVGGIPHSQCIQQRAALHCHSLNVVARGKDGNVGNQFYIVIGLSRMCTTVVTIIQVINFQEIILLSKYRHDVDQLTTAFWLLATFEKAALSLNSFAEIKKLLFYSHSVFTDVLANKFTNKA